VHVVDGRSRSEKVAGHDDEDGEAVEGIETAHSPVLNQSPAAAASVPGTAAAGEKKSFRSKVRFLSSLFTLTADKTTQKQKLAIAASGDMLLRLTMSLRSCLVKTTSMADQQKKYPLPIDGGNMQDFEAERWKKPPFRYPSFTTALLEQIYRDNDEEIAVRGPSEPPTKKISIAMKYAPYFEAKDDVEADANLYSIVN
jgi:hypothetical protein